MIREVRAADAPHWAEMRHQLWPFETVDAHADDVRAFFGGTRTHIATAFISFNAEGKPDGFLEMSLRSVAEGCTSSPVPHVEGWFVHERSRGTGVGRALMQAAENWARERGFAELTSDTELENERSLAAHLAIGFVEIERLIAFRKSL